MSDTTKTKQLNAYIAKCKLLIDAIGQRAAGLSDVDLDNVLLETACASGYLERAGGTAIRSVKTPMQVNHQGGYAAKHRELMRQYRKAGMTLDLAAQQAEKDLT